VAENLIKNNSNQSIAPFESDGVFGTSHVIQQNNQDNCTHSCFCFETSKCKIMAPAWFMLRWFYV